MKKFIASVAAGALMLVGASQAMAYFEDLHLIRSIYTTTGAVEVGSDLGAGVETFKVAPNYVPPTTPLNQFRGDVISLSEFDGPLSSLRVAYWSHDEANRDFYATGFLTTAFGGTDLDGLNMLGKKESTGNSTMNGTQRLYGGFGTSKVIVNPKTTIDSYWNAFEKNGTVTGLFASNLAADSAEMTLSLAALQTEGYVDQLLYFFNYNGSGTTVQGVPIAVIRTFLTTDGRTIDLAGNKLATVINPVPIPAAGWLLGSGLLALIGIRRRNG